MPLEKDEFELLLYIYEIRRFTCGSRWHGGSGGAPGGGMVWFDGAGYAELRRASSRPYDDRQFSISFTFRTRDRDALLFMALDTAHVCTSVLSSYDSLYSIID